MSLSTETKVRAGLALASALLLVIVFSAYHSAVTFSESGRWVVHTREGIESLESLLGAMLDVETGTRGYCLTGDETFLDPFRAGIQAAPQQLAAVRRLMADNPAQERRLDALEPVLRQKIAWSRRQVEVRSEQGAGAVADRTSSLEGKRLMDDVRARIEEMRKEERDLRDQRIDQWNASERRTIVAFALLVSMTVGLLGAVYSLYRRDNRARRRAERDLVESERRLQAILAHTPAIVYMKDLQGRFLLMNHRFEDLFRIKVHDLLGKTVHDFFPKEAADGYQANDLKAIAGGVPVQVEEVALQEDGPHTYLSLKAPVMGPGGVPYALCGISTDITLLKRTEEELRRAKEAAEASSRELEAFSYSVSHDLRAPLRSIDGFSQALLEDYASILDDQGKQHLQRVRAASQRMGQLIDDLLDLSRLTRAEMRHEQVDLSGLVRVVANELKRSDPGRKVKLEVAEGAVVHGDERLLRVVLENLLGNAWKFTKERPVAHVTFGTRRENGGRAFYVQDDGAGFEMAYAHKLFGAFQRLHTTQDFEGTGIGLATVARIIHRHGGKVWAEGEPGRGATFFFTV